MWNGSLAPRVTKADNTCTHGGTYVKVGEVNELGLLEIIVQFNHSCKGYGPAPSNNTTYLFSVDLDDLPWFTRDGAREGIDQMDSSTKLKWVSENLVHNEEVISERLTPATIDGRL